MNKLFLVFFFLPGLSAQGQDLMQYEAKQFHSANGTLLYRCLMPENFDPDGKYPILLFLHGAGERGDDNKKQLIHGAKWLAEEKNRSEHPAILLFPQCPEQSYWANASVDRSKPDSVRLTFPLNGQPTKPLQLVMDLLDSVLDQAYVDSSRIYVMGLSMGGMGTFELIGRRPDTFAAAVPICGGGNTGYVARYADKVRLWIFHGAKDNVVSPWLSFRMARKLMEAGANPGLTIFPEANHNSWDSAFAQPGLMNWIFSQSKNNE